MQTRHCQCGEAKSLGEEVATQEHKGVVKGYVGCACETVQVIEDTWQ